MALEMQQKLATGPLPTRAEQLRSLQEKHFDILVIGGGATGCGVALDAASRGMSRAAQLRSLSVASVALDCSCFHNFPVVLLLSTYIPTCIKGLTWRP